MHGSNRHIFQIKSYQKPKQRPNQDARYQTKLYSSCYRFILSSKNNNNYMLQKSKNLFCITMVCLFLIVSFTDAKSQTTNTQYGDISYEKSEQRIEQKKKKRNQQKINRKCPDYQKKTTKKSFLLNLKNFIIFWKSNPELQKRKRRNRRKR